MTTLEPSGSHKNLPVMFANFPDSDTHCIVDGVGMCKSKPVIIFHRLYPNQNDQLIKLLFLIDLAHEHGAKSVTVFTPYLPYSRQDKRHLDGEVISVDVICGMLKRAGCKTLYTLDCHFMKGNKREKRGGLQVVNVSIGAALVAAYQQKLGHNNFDVVGPDKGSEYLTQGFGGRHMHKKRGDYSDLGAAISYRDIDSLTDDHISHEHDHVLLIDDMISTGSTLIKAAERLNKKGISHIACATTHGFFLHDSLSMLQASMEDLLYSDSIIQPNATVKVTDIFKDIIVPIWQKKGQKRI